MSNARDGGVALGPHAGARELPAPALASAPSEPSEPTAAPAKPAASPLAVRAVGSSVWSFIGQGVQVLLGLATFALLSRWLTPFDYGLLGMAATVTAFVGIVGDAGITSAILRLPTIDATAEATGFWLGIAGAGSLTAICAIAAPIIARFYRTPAVMPLALGMAATFLLAAPGRVSQGKLGRHLRMRATTLTSLGANAAAIATAIFLASRGFGAWALVAQSLVTILLQAALSIALAPPRVSLRLYSRERARSMARFGWQVSGYSFAVMIGRSLDAVLAGRFLGSTAVGFMAMGQRLVFITVERLCAATASVFLPTAVEIGDTARQARAFETALRLLMMIIAPFCFGAIAVAPELVSLLPRQWSGLAPFIRIYAVGSLFAGLNHLTFSILVAHGRGAQLLRIALLLIPVTWAGAALGAFTGSVLVIAASFGFGLALGAIIQLGVVWRIIGLGRGLWTRLAPPLVASAAMAVVVRLVLRATGLAGARTGFVVGAIIGAVVYAAAIWIVMRADILRIADLLRRSAARRRTAS